MSRAIVRRSRRMTWRARASPSNVMTKAAAATSSARCWFCLEMPAVERVLHISQRGGRAHRIWRRAHLGDLVVGKDDVEGEVKAVTLDDVERVAQSGIRVAEPAIDNRVDRAVERRVLRPRTHGDGEPAHRESNDQGEEDEEQGEACGNPHWRAAWSTNLKPTPRMVVMGEKSSWWIFRRT